MKIIKVESCMACPYISGWLCKQMFDAEKHRCKEIPDRKSVPDWCPLLDTKDIVEKHPLTSGYATDARYVWPERWKEIEEMEGK